MIRHYEAGRLIQPAARTDSNYRVYTHKGAVVLCFVGSARQMSFSMKLISVLLSLWDDPWRSNSEVKQLAKAHLAEVAGLVAIDLQVIALLQAASVSNAWASMDDTTQIYAKVID